MRQHAIHERHIVWSDLDPVLCREFGPADASLIAVAQGLISRGRPRVITSDNKLRLRCKQLDAPILGDDPWELIAEHMD
jgi:hypothetical protein